MHIHSRPYPCLLITWDAALAADVFIGEKSGPVITGILL